MATIKYSRTCVLNVKQADNAMSVYLNADTAGPQGLLFGYETNRLGTAPPNASVDMTSALSAVGGGGKLSIIGSNFTGGGGMEVHIIADGNAQKVVSEALPQYTSKMWTVDIVKS